MSSRKTTPIKNHKSTRDTRRRTTRKGREIISSITEAIEVECAGLSIESRFTVRTVELGGYDGSDEF
jgi:hypothetical protein